MYPLLLVLALSSDFKFSDKAQELRSKLPKTGDQALRALYNKHLIFYTEKEVPRAFQFEGSLHDAYTNIAPPHEPYGNANREFPWDTPGGTHRSKIKKFNFLHLPGPITYWKGSAWSPVTPVDPRIAKLSDNYRPVTRWTYPDETVFGEVILNQQGKPFELRTRKKLAGKWTGVNTYRPFATREDYDAFVRRNGASSGGLNLHVATLKNEHPITVFKETALVDTLPALDKLIVDKALDLPFVNTRGQPWISKDGVENYAPTTEQEYHIVPKNYDGGFIATDSKSCMRCHDSTMQDASYFQPKRDWYGFVRGDDNIIGFHIFDPKSVKGDGLWNKGYSVNAKLVEAGLLKLK